MVTAKQGRIKAEGGVIMSKNFLKPGRFEINMRPMPREGGVTAMWTYYCATGNEETSQNEIDIELGGDGQYTNQWCTTWTTHSMKETQMMDVSINSPSIGIPIIKEAGRRGSIGLSTAFSSNPLMEMPFLLPPCLFGLDFGCHLGRGTLISTPTT